MNTHRKNILEDVSDERLLSFVIALVKLDV